MPQRPSWDDMSQTSSPIIHTWFTTRLGNAFGWRGAVLAPDVVTLHLNFHGEAEVLDSTGRRTPILPGTLAWLSVDHLSSDARRLTTSSSHECLVVSVSRAWLADNLSAVASSIAPVLRNVLLPPFATPAFCQRSLTSDDEKWALDGDDSAGAEAAISQRLLSAARLTEFVLREAFSTTEYRLHAKLRERKAVDRIRTVKKALLENLQECLPLEELARLAGCSRSYLSRVFKEVEGCSMSLWLRKARVDEAAMLLSTGQCNVSEAAHRVGYQSLSHFSRAFKSEKGASPLRFLRQSIGSL